MAETLQLPSTLTLRLLLLQSWQQPREEEEVRPLSRDARPAGSPAPRQRREIVVP